MRRCLGLLALLLFFSLPAKAQLTPKYEVSGGFEYVSFVPESGATRLNMFGWNANGVYNVFHWIGGAVETTGTYNTQSSSNKAIDGTSTHIYTFMAGPRFYPLGHRKLTLFGQVLFGGGHISEAVPAVPPFPAATLTDTELTWSSGIGLDYRWRENWAFRLNIEYLQTRFFNATNGDQGSERATFGFVYRWGVAGTRRKKIR